MKPRNQAVFMVMGVEQSDSGGEANTLYISTFFLYHTGLFFFYCIPDCLEWCSKSIFIFPMNFDLLSSVCFCK